MANKPRSTQSTVIGFSLVLAAGALAVCMSFDDLDPISAATHYESKVSENESFTIGEVSTSGLSLAPNSSNAVSESQILAEKAFVDAEIKANIEKRYREAKARLLEDDKQSIAMDTDALQDNL
ncbi:MAG: hypothetical protein MI867_10200 [Pseudomonadales bacterium]|nr:hypothetical protein [Pseudomonadales bacterium]